MTFDNDDDDDELDPSQCVKVEDLEELTEKAREMERKRQEVERQAEARKPRKSSMNSGEKKKKKKSSPPSQRAHGEMMTHYWQKQFQAQSTLELNPDETSEKIEKESTGDEKSTERNSAPPKNAMNPSSRIARMDSKNKSYSSEPQLDETVDTLDIQQSKASAGTKDAPQTTLARSTRSVRSPGAYSFVDPGAENADDDDIDDDDVDDRLEQATQSTRNNLQPNLSASVEASMVTDAEKIYVAENTKHDKYRRNMLIIFLFAVFVIALSIFLLVHFLRPGTENTDPCDTPIEEQPIALRCKCHNKTGDFYQSLSAVGKEAYFQQTDFLIETGFMTGNVTDMEDSCSVDNQNLLIAADIAQTSVRGIDFWTKKSPAFQLSSHTLIEMYLTMGGLDWYNGEDWLTDAICSWFGVKCVFAWVIEEFNMPDNGLHGTIPTSIGFLDTVRRVEIFDNEDVHGSIPSQLGQLTELQDLTLRELALTGVIPTELASLQRVDMIDLSGNTLTGTIPSGLYDLKFLRTLLLSGNELSGTIPPGIGNSSRLVELDLGRNELQGSLPSEMRLLTHLEILGLQQNNFSGRLPAFLGELPFLSLLYLEGSGLDVQGIPDTFCESKRRRLITIDCPIDAPPPKCNCCNQSDASGFRVQVVCQALLEEDNSNGG